MALLTDHVRLNLEGGHAIQMSFTEKGWEQFGMESRCFLCSTDRLTRALDLVLSSSKKLSDLPNSTTVKAIKKEIEKDLQKIVSLRTTWTCRASVCFHCFLSRKLKEEPDVPHGDSIS